MAVAALLGCVLSGCAITTTFIAYPGKMQPFVTDIAAGKPVRLDKHLLWEQKGQDKILYAMERGRIAQIQGDVETSIASYELAIKAIRENEERAVVSMTEAGGQTAAVLVNDNAIPYQGEGYERVLLHHFQAMNYLAAGDLTGAGVEVRRANSEQQKARQRYEQQMAKSGGGRSQGSGSVQVGYERMDELASRVADSFLNAYTFYVSAIIYELLDQPNDAYIDYRRALEIFPENRYLRADVLRLGKELAMDEDLARLADVLGDSGGSAAGPLTASGSGELIVLFEDGFVPRKHEVEAPVPVPGVRHFSFIAFPVYTARWQNSIPLAVHEKGTLLGTTEPICHVGALAVKALQESVPAIVARQILRATAKAVAMRQASENLGPLGELGAILYSVITENADLRSWLTLPDTAQVMRLSLPAGRHLLRLGPQGGGAGVDSEVSIRPSGKTLLRVIRAGGHMYVSSWEF